MFGFKLGKLGAAVKSAFSPRSLFSAGEQGVWYDPSDFSTLFQDSAGTTPVTSVEQPCGLMLDKSKGLVLGAELVTNGGFDSDTAWTKGSGWSISGGVAVKASGVGSALSQDINAVAGSFYKVSVTVSRTAGFGFLRIGSLSINSFPISTAGTNTYTYLIPCGSDSDLLYVFGDSAFVGSIDNISVKELPGNHATQSTAASRPVVSARVNLLTKTEDFGDAVWTVKVTPVYDVADPNGGTKAIRVTSTGANQIVLRQSNYASELNVSYRHRIAIRRVVGTGVVEMAIAGNNRVDITSQVSTSWAYAFLDGVNPITSGAYGYFYITLGTSGDSVEVAFPDARPTNTGVNLPSYQRVNTSTDYDTIGFPHGDKFDGVDDAMATAAGGGATTAFFWCSSIVVGKIGAAQTLFSDTGTNTGYLVRINSSNQLALSAGNGAAYTTIATVPTLAVGQRAVLTAWDDGVNLNVQIDSGAVASVARPVVSAGTAAITIGKDNGAATSFFLGSIYEYIYVKDDVQTAAQISGAKTYCAQKALVTL